jgi:S-adenosylmethionine-diacylgycerolhomoserine-N-methlytransferase
MSARLQKYYKIHSKIYDNTRWTFLFGRKQLLQALSSYCSPGRILEIGCGTGKNLTVLSRLFPEAHITSIDLSKEMLSVARKNIGKAIQRIRLINSAYCLPLAPECPFDLVIFSYTLSMINPGWSHAIRCANADLRPDGIIAAVDFHNSPYEAFKSWMQVNHVQMQGHLLPELNLNFSSEIQDLKKAYGGLWNYFIYIGKKF